MHESKVDSLKEHDMVWKHFIFKELMFQKKKELIFHDSLVVRSRFGGVMRK